MVKQLALHANKYQWTYSSLFKFIQHNALAQYVKQIVENKTIFIIYVKKWSKWWLNKLMNNQMKPWYGSGPLWYEWSESVRIRASKRTEDCDIKRHYTSWSLSEAVLAIGPGRHLEPPLVTLKCVCVCAYSYCTQRSVPSKKDTAVGHEQMRTHTMLAAVL